MKAAKFRKIRTYMTSWEAEQARNFLESQGIRAFVEGVNTQMTLSYAGGSISGVKLLVSVKDFELAEQVLANHTDPLSSTAWTCRRCYSDVDAGFDVCWKCGADRGPAPTENESTGQHRDEERADRNPLSGEQPPPLASLAINPPSRGLTTAPQSLASDRNAWLAPRWILLWATIEIAALLAYSWLQSLR